jgi:hypothetical protein
MNKGVDFQDMDTTKERGCKIKQREPKCKFVRGVRRKQYEKRVGHTASHVPRTEGHLDTFQLLQAMEGWRLKAATTWETRSDRKGLVTSLNKFRISLYTKPDMRDKTVFIDGVQKQN